MDKSIIFYGINLLILFLVFIGYPGLIIGSLISLKKRKLNLAAFIFWTLIILFVPLAGVIVFWIVNPIAKNEVDIIE